MLRDLGPMEIGLILLIILIVFGAGNYLRLELPSERASGNSAAREMEVTRIFPASIEKRF